MSENETNQNQVMGCATVATIVINLFFTISIIRHFNGFWYCTGAFFTFFIGGTIGSAIGIAIGSAIAKAQDCNDMAKQIGFSILGLLIGSSAAAIGIGNLIYGINVMKIIFRQ